MAFISRFGPNPEARFYQCPEEMMLDGDLTDTEFRVLILLLHYEKKRQEFPSLRDVARQRGVHHTKLIRAMDTLVEKGYVLRYERRGVTSVYCPAYPAVPLDHEARPAFEAHFRQVVQEREGVKHPRVVHIAPDKAPSVPSEGGYKRAPVPPGSGYKRAPVVVTKEHQSEEGHLIHGEYVNTDSKNTHAAGLDFALPAPPPAPAPEPPKRSVLPASPAAPKQGKAGGKQAGKQAGKVAPKGADAPAAAPAAAPEPNRKLSDAQKAQLDLAWEGLLQRCTVANRSLEGKGITAMVKRGRTAAEILACYDHFKPTQQWRVRHLNMIWIDTNIDDWLAALSPRDRRQLAEGTHGTTPTRTPGVVPHPGTAPPAPGDWQAAAAAKTGIRGLGPSPAHPGA